MTEAPPGDQQPRLSRMGAAERLLRKGQGHRPRCTGRTISRSKRDGGGIAVRAAVAWADGARRPGLEARSGPTRARVRPRRPATSPRVRRWLADPQLWAWTRSAAHRRAVSGDRRPPSGPRRRAGAKGARRASLRGGASHEAEGRGGARTGRAGLVGPGRRRLCVVRQIGDQLVPGIEQFLLVNKELPEP